jgi:hypothetical protein
MATTVLKRSIKIHALAGDLGIKASGDPVREIVRFCEKRIRRFLRDFPDCATLSELLEIAASKLGTRFEEIRSDEDLEEVRGRYLRQGEKAFAELHEELSPQVFGVTFRRVNKKGWELPFVSVIDCRGEKRFRSYYTKWHELGHLLILTDQMRLTFRRTHFELEDKDPEEALVDVIAGAFGFLPDLVRPQATGQPTFDRIEEIRTQLCPEASQQASLIGIAKAWPTPCILLQAQMALKRGEKRDLVQSGFDFQDVPKEVLRAVQVTPNDAARAVNFVIFQNMRVPARSLITEVFLGNLGDAQAVENLSWWESSDGSQLPDVDVFVQARQAWGGVQAIISPQHSQ